MRRGFLLLECMVALALTIVSLTALQAFIAHGYTLVRNKQQQLRAVRNAFVLSESCARQQGNAETTMCTMTDDQTIVVRTNYGLEQMMSSIKRISVHVCQGTNEEKELYLYAYGPTGFYGT